MRKYKLTIEQFCASGIPATTQEIVSIEAATAEDAITFARIRWKVPSLETDPYKRRYLLNIEPEQPQV